MALPVSGYFSNAARTKGEIKTALEDQRNEVEAPCQGMRAYKSSGADAITGLSWVGPLALQTENYDELNEFNVTTSLFTASRAGTYQVDCGACLTNIGAGEVGLAIFANGAEHSSATIYPTVASRPCVITHSDKVKLAVGGTIGIYARQGSGSSKNTDLTYATFLAIARISKG